MGGTLSGTPTAINLGANEFTVVATDVDGSTEATLNIEVLNPQPPVWDNDPTLGKDAFIGLPYSDTLAGKATDPNGDPITYSLVDVGTWLSVETNGVLSGMPSAGDLGANTFKVRATDVDGSTDAQLNIEVAELIANPVIAWNFSERWGAKEVGGETADGTDQWTDSTSYAAPVGYSVANSTDSWATTTPVSASHVTVAWSSSGLYQAGPETGNPEQQLYRKYLDDGGDGPTITVSGLSEWLAAQGANAYTVIFYRATGGATVTFAELNIYEGTGTGGTLLESLPAELAAGDGGYPTETLGDGNSRLKQSATNAFNAGTVTFHTDRNLGGGSRAGLAGFKIAAVVDNTPGAQVTDLVIAGPFAGGMELSWTGENGKPYGVETNSNLILSGGWASWLTNQVGNGGTIAITNTIGPDQTFYRVISE